MRPKPIVAALLVLALATAGCARATRGRAGGESPDTSVTRSVMDPGSPVPSPTPRLVTPRDGLVDVRPRPFDRARVEDERTVLLEYYTGVEECYGLDRVDVRYRRDSVVLTIHEGRLPAAEVCIDLAEQVLTRVRLDEPLAGRKIVDGAAER